MLRIRFPRTAALAAALFAITLAGVDTAAQQPRRLRVKAAAQAPTRDGGTEPAELARLFDAYTVMQAQEALDLDEARFGPFVTRLRALQQLRRRQGRDRTVLLREMRQLLQSPGNDVQLQAKLDALGRLDMSSRAEEQKAREAVDEILDVRQRARFRLLEQQLELRKLELVNRARARQRANRP